MSAQSRWVGGVDGCRGGWIVVAHPVGCPKDAVIIHARSFAEILQLPQSPMTIAIDIPIGLPERAVLGGRGCDNAARVPLGDRRSSIFSVPARAAVFEDCYTQACATAATLSDPPRKVSKQAFNLFPKIREVDALMTPLLQARVVECHPELAFWRLNGSRPLSTPKKIKSVPCPDGMRQRRDLLIAAGYDSAILQSSPFPRSIAGLDDVIDAFACVAAACAIVHGDAVRFPHQPQCDAKGLRMEIWC